MAKKRNGGEPAREFARQLDTPERVAKSLRDALRLFADPPSEYVAEGETKPLSPEAARTMAELLRIGAFAQLVRWYRDERRHPDVTEVLDSLDEGTLRFTAAMLIGQLAETGWEVVYGAADDEGDEPPPPG
jgi:hypothetical protein